MKGYLLRRVLMLPVLWLGISVITFLVMQLSPGKPSDVLTDMNVKLSAEAKERLKKLYGLDRPLHVQYGRWLKRMARLDFGTSFRDGRPVLHKIAERLPATLLLNFASLLLILAIAVPIGVLAARRPGGGFDTFTTVAVYLGISVPAYWLALLLMVFFGVKLGWLPVSGMTSVGFGEMPPWEKAADLAKHLLLPTVVSAFTGLAGMSRYTRSAMLEQLRQEYIRAARARGIPEGRVLWAHGFRNALLPVVTLLGLSLPDLISGGFIFETIFAWPGMGRLGYQSILARDYPVLMGVAVIAALLTLLGNLLADLAYAWADPRIRYK